MRNARQRIAERRQYTNSCHGHENGKRTETAQLSLIFGFARSAVSRDGRHERTAGPTARSYRSKNGARDAQGCLPTMTPWRRRRRPWRSHLQPPNRIHVVARLRSPIHARPFSFSDRSCSLHCIVLSPVNQILIALPRKKASQRVLSQEPKSAPTDLPRKEAVDDEEW